MLRYMNKDCEKTNETYDKTWKGYDFVTDNIKIISLHKTTLRFPLFHTIACIMFSYKVRSVLYLFVSFSPFVNMHVP